MFKDYKTRGYNLESAKANETRLNNLILLIAISYTLNSFEGQKLKIKGFENIYQELIKKIIKERINSIFFVGSSRTYCTINDDLIWELVENLMSLNPHKLLYYLRGLSR